MKCLKSESPKQPIKQINDKFQPEFPQNMKAFNSNITLTSAYNLLLSIGNTNGDKGCIKKEELANTLLMAAEKKFVLKAYDGFEPSGRMHIAQGLMKTINVNKMTKCGLRVILLVADWFACLNEKFNGDLKKIRKVGEYFIEVWKATGMDLDKVDFVWSSEEINKKPNEYWTTVMDIARKNTVSRVKRCGQIMGRVSVEDSISKTKELLTQIYSNREKDKDLDVESFINKYTSKSEPDSQPVAQLLYPLMQCTDIFFLGANVCQLGLDQLKVNMLAREYCNTKEKKKKILRKPIILSHPMLMGLKEGQAKMSKSNPESAIFMEDSKEDVQRKIRKAFCPPKKVETNPVLDYLKHIIFPWHEFHLNYKKVSDKGEDNFLPFKLKVERALKDGGDVEFSTFEEVCMKYSDGSLHPSDLKKAVAREINLLLDPVRKHFSEGKAKEMLKHIKKLK